MAMQGANYFVIEPCARISYGKATERSTAWLVRLLWEQEVARSNRAAPTIPFSTNGNVAGIDRRRNAA